MALINNNFAQDTDAQRSDRTLLMELNIADGLATDSAALDNQIDHFVYQLCG
jgi:hypothetical protein